MNTKPPIFIGGAGRSGTTLLRVILDSHPNIACGPELKITPIIASCWYDFQTKYSQPLKEYLIGENEINEIFSRMIISLLERYRIDQGKIRIAEKTPHNVTIFSHLHKIFPESPLVHVVRDGRDVISSLLTMDWKGFDGQPLPYTQNVEAAAKYWRDTVQTGLRFNNYSTAHSKSCHIIKYENLVSAPKKHLEELFNFIDEPWRETVLDFHKNKRNLANESSASQVKEGLYTSSMNRWKKDLSLKQQDIIKPIINETLIELGYVENQDW